MSATRKVYEMRDGVLWLSCRDCGGVFSADNFPMKQKKFYGSYCKKCGQKRNKEHSRKKRAAILGVSESEYAKELERKKEIAALRKKRYEDCGNVEYTPTTNRANICLDCQNAVGGCSWSAVDETKKDRPIKFEPVDGWTAVPVTRLGNAEIVETFCITDCPLFIPDEKRISYTYDDEEDE